MELDTFWQLIDKTRTESNGDVDRQADLLVESLVPLPLEELFSYWEIFDTYDSCANRYELCQVADLIYGGIGDSGWKDFRGWFIAQGKQVYEQVLADPESLIDLVSEETRYDIQAERILYVGYYTYERKTGSNDVPLEAISGVREDIPYEIEPWGKSWRDTHENHTLYLKEKFPRAWAKFGYEP